MTALTDDTPRLKHGPLRVGIGGPVGAGKTSMTEALCRALSPHLSMAVITNDIYTREDADFLVRAQALPAERIRGVETGGRQFRRREYALPEAPVPVPGNRHPRGCRCRW